MITGVPAAAMFIAQGVPELPCDGTTGSHDTTITKDRNTNMSGNQSFDKNIIKGTTQKSITLILDCITRHSVRSPIKRVHIASEASLVVQPSARKKSIPSSVFKRVTPTNVVMKRKCITDHVIPGTAGSGKRREPTSIAIARHH